MFRYVMLLVSVNIYACDYRMDGDFILGAILPLSKSNTTRKCAIPNPEGISAAEVYINALETTKTNSDFRRLFERFRKVGYDIRDNCNDILKEKEIAYNLSKQTLAYSVNKALQKPPNIVLSHFTKESLPTVYVLGAEKIPQISYIHNNARLTSSAQNFDENQPSLLVSAYPDNIDKMHAVFDLIKEYKFQYIFTIVSDDYQGITGLKLIKDNLRYLETFSLDYIIGSNKTDISKIVNAFQNNPLVTVAIIHCPINYEISLYKELSRLQITNLNFISTQNWQSHENILQDYALVVEGMIYIQYEDEHNSIEDYFKSAKVSIPFTGKDWILPLFELKGGKSSCLKSGVNLTKSEQDACKAAERKTQNALAKEAKTATSAYVSAYVIMSAAKAQSQDQSLIDAMKLLQFKIPYLPQNTFQITRELTMNVTKYTIYNVQGNTKTDFTCKWLGYWDVGRKTPYHGSLYISKGDVRWKTGSRKTPVSVCAEPCKKGYKMVRKQKCWVCEKCPISKISNETNAKVCVTCPINTAPSLDQTDCVKYELITFQWLGAMGSFVIFLIFFGVCVVLFGCGVLLHYGHHELVVLSGGKALFVYLLGCLILILSPIPLLVTPTSSSCSIYISFFNLGTTFCLSVMMCRSALVNSFYDNDGKVVRKGFSAHPRGFLVLLVVGVQSLILFIGLLILPPGTSHSVGEVWNERYFECSTSASYSLWIGFCYNIVLSVIANFLSCSSKQMEEKCGELKWILITYCLFYLVAFVEIVIHCRFVNKELALAQALMCILLGLIFFFFYIWPKIYFILLCKDQQIKTRTLHINKHDLFSIATTTTAVTMLLSSSNGSGSKDIV